MIVMKFGGTSVQSAEWMNNALDIAESQLNRAPVMVSSAMGKTTDKLVNISLFAAEGKQKEAEALLSDIKHSHLDTAKEFLSEEFYEKALWKLEDHFKELTSLVRGLLLLKECTERSSDALLSFGELLSTTLLAYRAKERGIETELLDSRDLVVTDNVFTNASPKLEVTLKKIQEAVKPRAGKLYIAQGFIGRNEKGAVTTLGRGGSDFTATIFGSALNAEEVQIWTDVDGIMSTDPRIVPEAKTIPQISYEEAAELAYFGAKVVHPSTIQPAVENSTPVMVKNTRNTNGPHTAIIPSTGETGLKAISGKKNITLVSITSSRMLNAYGFLSRIFVIFAKYCTPVDLIATSEVSVSMTIENTTNLEDIVNELEELGKVTTQHENGIICLVGQDFWKDSGFVAGVFNALQPIHIRMISLGSSDTNLSLVVPEKHLEVAIQKLHGAFISNPA